MPLAARAAPKILASAAVAVVLGNVLTATYPVTWTVASLMHAVSQLTAWRSAWSAAVCASLPETWTQSSFPQ